MYTHCIYAVCFCPSQKHTSLKLRAKDIVCYNDCQKLRIYRYWINFGHNLESSHLSSDLIWRRPKWQFNDCLLLLFDFFFLKQTPVLLLDFPQAFNDQQYWQVSTDYKLKPYTDVELATLRTVTRRFT